MIAKKVYYDKPNIYIANKMIEIGDNKYATARITSASMGVIAAKYGAVIAFLILGTILATVGFAGGELKACGSIAFIMFGVAAVLVIEAKQGIEFASYKKENVRRAEGFRKAANIL